MSIFSKLLKRGPEEGGPTSAERGDPPAPEKAASAERPAAVAAPAQPAAAQPAPAPKNSVAAPGAKAAPTRAPAAAPAARPSTGPSKVPAAAAAPAAAPAKAAPARAAAPAAAPTVSPFPKPAPAAGASRAPAARPEPAKGRTEDAVPAQQPAAESLSGAIEQLFAGPGAIPASVQAGTSTESDLAAVLSTFEDLAVGHSADVRNLMMEVRWGEAQTSWFELARPALKSLRTMAGQVGHTALTAGLDAFCAAVDEALAPGAAPTVTGATRDKLLAAYAPLVAALPSAFELQGERDRREPLVVRALLGQVSGLEPLMIDRMIAAGLGRLEPLFKARADEIAAVAGLAPAVAAAIVARVQAWRRANPAALATPDRNATARELVGLVEELDANHRAFEEASRGWTEADRDAKKRLRRERELTFLQICIVLARLGEVDLALALEKHSFARRLEELGRLVARFPPVTAPRPEATVHKIDREIPSGAHAAS
jgi:hypothetical protein